MPAFLKHVGQVTDTGKKCVVIFRSLPDDDTFCLVTETETLDQLYHDDLQSAVESPGAQDTIDFYKYAQRAVFHDGSNMLEGLHLNGWLKKIPTSNVTMKPTNDVSIQLNELNIQLAEITTSDPSKTTMSDISRTIDSVQESKPAGVLDDEQIAANMRAQAAQFKAEADRLLKEANELSPIKVSATSKQKRTYNKKK